MKNLLPFILIIIAIIGFFMFVDPRYKEVKELQLEIEQNNKTLDLARELREKRDALRERYNQISNEERFELKKLLPDTVDNVRLIIDINNIAERYGIVIQDISVSATEESNDDVRIISSEFEGIIDSAEIEYPDTSKIGVISFSFSTQAQYDVFLDFLKDLEEALRIVDIRSIDIVRGTEEDVFYEYRINLDTYWLK
jgi:Tfp pilus assembly protein PilO